MFTGNTVQLMQFDGQFGLQVVRDCALSYVAKIPSELERRLVPCGEARHVVEAAALAGFQWADFPSRIDPAADIRPGAGVAERNVVIGPATVVMPGAVICERS